MRHLTEGPFFTSGEGHNDGEGLRIYILVKIPSYIQMYGLQNTRESGGGYLYTNNKVFGIQIGVTIRMHVLMNGSVSGISSVTIPNLVRWVIGLWAIMLNLNKSVLLLSVRLQRQRVLTLWL